MTTQIILAAQVKKGNMLVENGGASFPVIAVSNENGKTIIKIDTSDYFLSFRVKEKTISFKASKKLMILA